MSGNQSPAVDPTAREMIAAVREFVQELMRDVFRMGMQGGENATNAYAHACMENLPEHRLPALSPPTTLWQPLSMRLRPTLRLFYR